MSEHSISAPAKGDPITAAWAQAITNAVNGSQSSGEAPDSMRTPDGEMSPPACASLMETPSEQDMAFDCRIVRSGGEDFLWIALPDAPDYVYLEENAISPDSAQTVGTEQNAFITLEKITNGTARGIYLAFAATKDEQTGEETITGWRVYVDELGADRPEWASEYAPVVLLASYNIAADDTSGADTAPGDVPSLQKGLVQYWRGTILAPYVPAEIHPTPEDVPVCGNPLNGLPSGVDDYNPLNGSADAIPNNTSQTGHPLDGEGEGGFTPLCADELETDPLAA